MAYLIVLLLALTADNLEATDFTDTIKAAKVSRFVGQGNPEITVHPVTKEQCLANAKNMGHSYLNKSFEKKCQAPFMAPLYDPLTETVDDAKVCIDIFEYPNRPCEYPVVWVRASEAHKICEQQGKRLCDAHEWEGACAGRLLPPDYPFAKEQGSPKETIAKWRKEHNSKVERTWAYGPKYQKGVCATGSFKTKTCQGGNWKRCGSNTYPSGYFPGCQSRLGVYDQHGNAAEHMSIPLSPEQMTSRGGVGYTEMKGSWFIFDTFYAHQDYCRWRAPFWHGSRLSYKKSHHNYHLGFRCCKNL